MSPFEICHKSLKSAIQGADKYKNCEKGSKRELVLFIIFDKMCKLSCLKWRIKLKSIKFKFLDLGYVDLFVNI